MAVDLEQGDHPDTLSGRLLAIFESQRLTPSHRRVAHALLGAGPRAGYLSSTELASLAGVSQPSVSRFARALGFRGYQDFRRHVQGLVGLDGARETGPDVLRNELEAAIRDEIAHLETLSDSLRDPGELYRLGAELAASRPLVVLGLRASAPLAEYFGYFADRALGQVRVITRFDSRGEEELLSAASDGADWMVCLALPRYPRETLEAVRQARALGMKVVTISDSTLGPFAEHSDKVLAVGVGSRLVFDSHSAAMMLCNALLGTLCDADPREVQRRLDSFEASAQERRVFVE